MVNVQSIMECSVGLPYGKKSTANKEGTVTLEGGLKLRHVLFVSDLNCNIIYVSQLIDESNCIVQFTDNLCVMQDRTTRMVIGAGERQDGLYFFRGVSHVRAFTVDGDLSAELWHKRLGNP